MVPGPPRRLAAVAAESQAPWAVLSVDDVLLARFSATRFGPGYDQGEVDELLDRVVQTLREAGTREPLRRDVTVEELDGVTFRQTSWGEGYAIDEVDAFLAELRPSLANLASRPVATSTAAGSTWDHAHDGGPDPERPTGWRLVGQVLETMMLGERPTEPRPLVKPSKAPRASMKNVVVTAHEVRWRARRRVEGRLAVAEIRQVVLMDLDHGSGSPVLIPYALVVDRPDGRLGPGLRRLDVDCKSLNSTVGSDTTPAPVSRPNGAKPCSYSVGGGRLLSGGVPLLTLARSITGAVGRVVLDRTGLQGDYEFTLEYSTKLDDGKPSVFTAVREQLGLKLEAQDNPLDVVVVDRIEHPSIAILGRQQHERLLRTGLGTCHSQPSGVRSGRRQDLLDFCE